MKIFFIKFNKIFFLNKILKCLGLFFKAAYVQISHTTRRKFQPLKFPKLLTSLNNFFNTFRI